MIDEWKNVPGWSEFQVTKNGDIRQKSNGKVLHLKPDTCGYFRAASRDNKTTTFKKLSVHRAVLFAFVGQPKEGQEARHLNGIKTDNRLENLRWGNRQEQLEDDRRNKEIYMKQEELLTLQKAADYLFVHPQTIRYRIKVLGFPRIKTLGRLYFKKSEIDKWVAKQTTESTVAE